MSGTAKQTKLRHEDCVLRGGDALAPHVVRVARDHGRDLRVYGVPRGGACALLHLLSNARAHEALQHIEPVPLPYADVLLDDIVDSGRTRDRYRGVHKPFVALVDKTDGDKDLGWVVFPWEEGQGDEAGGGIDLVGPEDGVVRLLQGIGEDVTREGLRDTPKRVVKALAEMTAGYREDPKEILGRTFEDSYDEVVILKDIPFTSVCEHHLLPFTGTADVGYIPGKVVGLSKLARLVDCFARRLQMQERLTRQIAGALQEHLEARGVAVVVRASHACMGCRGVRKPGATMVTSVMLGAFRDRPEARAEFLSLCRE